MPRRPSSTKPFEQFARQCAVRLMRPAPAWLGASGPREVADHPRNIDGEHGAVLGLAVLPGWVADKQEQLRSAGSAIRISSTPWVQ